MDTQEFIPIDIFCRHHKVETSFIVSLQEFGLIEVTTIDETVYIPVNQLSQAEQLVRLYADLNINLEGIDAITHLLQRVRDMNHEIIALKNRLSMYEDL
jgi:hypothetical protein